MNKKIFHIRGCKLGITAVAEVNDNRVRVAVAYCSKKDLYNKKKGITIAEGRLKAGKVFDLEFSGHSQDDIITFYNNGTMAHAFPKAYKNTKLVPIGGKLVIEKK